MAYDLRTPLKRARNVGSARTGAVGWMAMHFTSWLLLPLTLWFVVLVLSLLHADYATALHRVGHPLNAGLLAIFVVLMAWHTELGLRNVYADYIHDHWVGFWTLMLTRVVLLFATVFAVGAVIRIAFVR